MKIRIEGITLKSLRLRYKASVDYAAKKANVESSTYESWEKNGTELSITDAKKLAGFFHSHWSVFLLHGKVAPIKEPVNHRAGYSDNSPFSDETLRAYEIARQLLDASVEIDGQKVDPRIRLLRKLCDKGGSSKIVASQTRQMLGVEESHLFDIKGGPYEVYNFWKQKVSSLGVYVSEQNMPIDETKAFLMESNNRAVIVVNKKDKYIQSRVFSMLHELGHLIMGENSAACMVNIAARSSKHESWSNKFASELIAPDAIVMSDDTVNTIVSSNDPAAIIRKLASKYRISFTVMLYKLHSYSKVTDTQCIEMKVFFDNVILPALTKRNNKSKEIKLGRMYYVGRDVSKASVGLSREVIERQLSGGISYSEAAKLLNTRAKYLEDIKTAVGFGS